MKFRRMVTLVGGCWGWDGIGGQEDRGVRHRISSGDKFIGAYCIIKSEQLNM